jgi:hypothetical protein
MFVLKPENEQGNFVSNLRKTTQVLTNTCKIIPKTAYRRSARCLKKIEPLSLNQHKMEMEVEVEMETEIETDEVVILQEPTGLF